MSCKIVIEQDLIRLTLTGVLTPADLADIGAAADEILRDLDPVPPRFTDMTGLTDLKISYPDVRKLADKIRAMILPNGSKSAIVVGSPSQMGIARMFQTLNDNPKIAISIFTEEAAAMKWLRT